MAIYHLNVKTGSRDGGQSARARAKYIAREGKCETGRDELAHSESGNMPEWTEDDPRQYWAAADAHERVNGRLFVQVEFALPRELNARQQQEVASRFAERVTGPEWLPYTLAIHRGGPDGGNPHAHLMISERGRDGHDRDAERWFKRYNAKEPEKDLVAWIIPKRFGLNPGRKSLCSVQLSIPMMNSGRRLKVL